MNQSEAQLENLRRYLRLAYFRLRKLRIEAESGSGYGSATRGMRMLEELIKEQIPNETPEDFNPPTR